MKNKNKFSVFLAVMLAIATLVSCTAAGNSAAGTSGSQTASTTTGAVDISDTVTYDSEDYSFDWQNQAHETINLNTGAATISKSGIYEITGTLKDGSLVVNVDKAADKGIVYLVLNNANIASSTSAPVYVKAAEKVVLILAKGTANTVYQGSGCVVDADNEPSAAIFSKSDLTITGSGTLAVTSDYNDGITSKDTLKITDGTLTVKAKGDGIVGKDVVAVKDGAIQITAAKDGVRATNETDAGLGNILIAGGNLTIEAGDDGLQAYRTLQVNAGVIQVTTGGGYAENTTVHTENGPDGRGGMNRPGQATAAGGTGSTDSSDSTGSTETTDSGSKQGLKAAGNILLTNGSITVSAYDDALNANGDLTIKGGTLTLQSGDDGIHSDTAVTVNGGTISIPHAYEGVEGKNITVNDGKITLTASDDGFNVNDSTGLLTVSGGEIAINAGGDGADSNGSIKMTGGTVYVDGPTDNGNGALDYNGSFTISGGTIIAAGSSGMAQAPSTDSSQPSILMYYSTAQAAGTPFTLKDSGGNTVATFTPAKSYSAVAVSAPGLKTGQAYTLYNGTTQVVTFTPTNQVTYLNESGITQGQTQGPGGGDGTHGGGMPDMQGGGGRPDKRQ
jgi:hypothetical protein